MHVYALSTASALVATLSTSLRHPIRTWGSIFLNHYRIAKDALQFRRKVSVSHLIMLTCYVIAFLYWMIDEIMDDYAGAPAADLSPTAPARIAVA